MLKVFVVDDDDGDDDQMTENILHQIPYDLLLEIIDSDATAATTAISTIAHCHTMTRKLCTFVTEPNIMCEHRQIQ